MEPWITAYLDRIKYYGSTEPSPANLAEIHQAHMYAVPFEDLDIHLGIPLSLELAHLKQKVIHNKRGGFCYELNFLFGNLLKELGYQVTFLSGRVINDKGEPGPEYDHMALMVTLNKKWLADVGFGGGSFTRPLDLKSRTVQINEAGYYKILEITPGSYQLSWSPEGKVYTPQYNFTLEPKEIQDFGAQCKWKQVDYNSHFVKKKICTMAIPHGRKSLLNDLFTVRISDQKESFKIDSSKMEKEVLNEHFSIIL